jgi:CRP-like cAMP-binding protein
LEDIHYNLKIINYEEGTSVIMKGTIADSIMFIVSGVLELYVEGRINDYSLETLKPGSVLGAYSVVTETKYEFSARA